ncbi:MAG: hypothetical protein IJ688_14835 [Treponema sp.]|nr:hypothetical protein [Treponema sp.]
MDGSETEAEKALRFLATAIEKIRGFLPAKTAGFPRKKCSTAFSKPWCNGRPSDLNVQTL